MKRRIAAIAINMVIITGMLSGCSGSDQGQTVKAAETTAKVTTNALEAEGTDTTDTKAVGVDAYSVGGNLALGAASSTETFYYVGTIIGDAVSSVNKLSVLVWSTNGPNENVAMYQANDTDTGMGNCDSLYTAYSEGMSYKGVGVQDILEAASLYNSQLHVFVSEKSGITDISQLRGKKVCVGSQGTSYLFINEALMAAYDISIDGIEPFYMDYAESTQALADGDIDVVFRTGEYPIAGTQQSTVTINFRMPLVDDAPMNNIIREYPFIIKITVPASIYENQANTKEVGILDYQTYLFASSKAGGDRIYTFVKLMMETLDTYRDTDDTTCQISKEMVATPYIPFHSGAERHYRETGILK